MGSINSYSKSYRFHFEISKLASIWWYFGKFDVTTSIYFSALKIEPVWGVKTSELAKTDLEFGASGPENPPKEFELTS